MNKLRRSVEVTYIPGEPAIPPTPPVCTTTTKRIKTDSGSSRIGSSTGDPSTTNSGSSINYTYVTPVYGEIEDNPLTPGPDFGIVGYTYARNPSGSSGTSAGSSYRTVTETTCTEGSPGSPGTPGTFKKEATGPNWQASSRSIAKPAGDVVASFDLNSKPSVAIGFGTRDTGPTFSDLRMGVLFQPVAQQVLVFPLIDGKQQTQAGVYTAGQRISLVRAGGRFHIQVGGNTVYSTQATTDEPVFLDAMLYTSTDYVENPEFSVASSAAASVSGSVGVDAFLSSRFSVDGEVGTTGVVGTLVDGVAVVPVRGFVGFNATAAAVSSSQLSVSGAIGLTGSLGALAEYAEVSAVLPALRMQASDYATAQIVSILPAPEVSAQGGVPAPEIAGADLAIPPLNMAALWYAGSLLTMQNNELPSISGLASDSTYAQVIATLPAPVVVADDGYTIPGFAFHVEQLAMLSEISTDPLLYAAILDGLELEPELSLTTLVDGSYFEGLLLDPDLSVVDYLYALIESGINLSSATQAPLSLVSQYAFDTDTGAATRYDGFNFDGFAYTGEYTYAYRADGIYRLRAGDDDGSVRNFMADFGENDYGTMEKKHIETVYIGLATNGTAYLKLEADDRGERVYRVIQRQPTYRVKTGRGITARQWQAKLEIVDATSAELDTVEFVVAASGRRWTR